MQSVKYKPEIKPDYKHKVDWLILSMNSNAIHILKENIDKVYWDKISYNPNVLYILCGIDYEAMKEAMKPLAEELAQRINNPRKYSSQEEFLQRQVELGFLDLQDIE